MKYDIKAIPQIYNGVQFRSRLEASWAAFFDLVDIQWEYEPFELNGWFPDFKIYKKNYGDKHLLVEVKPTDFYDVDFIKHLNKKISIATEQEVILLGERPCCGDESGNDMEGAIGLVLHDGEKDIAILNDFPTGNDVSDYYGSYSGKLTGYYEGNLIPVTNVAELWKTARNKTQWKKNPAYHF